jgi:hypothetical protein
VVQYNGVSLHCSLFALCFSISDGVSLGFDSAASSKLLVVHTDDDGDDIQYVYLLAIGEKYCGPSTIDDVIKRHVATRRLTTTAFLKSTMAT